MPRSSTEQQETDRKGGASGEGGTHARAPDAGRSGVRRAGNCIVSIDVDSLWCRGCGAYGALTGRRSDVADKTSTIKLERCGRRWVPRSPRCLATSATQLAGKMSDGRFTDGFGCAARRGPGGVEGLERCRFASRWRRQGTIRDRSGIVSRRFFLDQEFFPAAQESSAKNEAAFNEETERGGLPGGTEIQTWCRVPSHRGSTRNYFRPFETRFDSHLRGCVAQQPPATRYVVRLAFT